MMILQTILFIHFFFYKSTSWRLYEEPIRELIPTNGIYEINLVIEHTISMTRKTRLGQIHVLDYDPEKKEWDMRNPDIDSDCDSSSVLLNSSATEMNYIEEISDLLQYNGKHIQVVTINGESPAKPIAVPYGAEVIMRVINKLEYEAVTVHLHGVDKRNLWYTDGVAFVQQCPISPGSTHSYRFIADTPGTHWFHGHLMNDRADGLLGGFTIYPNDRTTPLADGGRITTDREYYMVLQDWATLPSDEQWLCQYHVTMKWVDSGFDGEGKDKCWAPKRTYDGSNIGGSVPLSAILVNSKGWYSQEDIRERPQNLPLTNYRIKKGEHQRYRIVNGGVSLGIMVWVEDHKLTVISADGVEVKPMIVDAVIIFPGERYDVHLQGLENPTKKTYRFILETLEHFNWNWTLDTPQFGLSNLIYEDVDLHDNGNVDFEHVKCTNENKCRILNCPFGDFPPSVPYKCISAHKLENADLFVDKEIIEKKMFRGNFREIIANMNWDNHMDGYMFQPPRGMPYYYHDKMQDIAVPCDPFKCDRFHSDRRDHSCDCFYHYHFNLGDIVQMTFYNMGNGGMLGHGYQHPFHIHGTHFYVMKIGYPEYFKENMTIKSMNPDIPCFDTTKACVHLHWSDPSWSDGNVEGMEKNPSFRDTINLPTGGYVTIRFRATNPGWWYAHCHLMLHHMGGTAFAFRIGTHEQVPKPPSNFPHSCGVFKHEIPRESSAHQSSLSLLIASILIVLHMLT